MERQFMTYTRDGNPVVGTDPVGVAREAGRKDARGATYVHAVDDLVSCADRVEEVKRYLVQAAAERGLTGIDFSRLIATLDDVACRMRRDLRVLR